MLSRQLVHPWVVVGSLKRLHFLQLFWRHPVCIIPVDVRLRVFIFGEPEAQTLPSLFNDWVSALTGT